MSGILTDCTIELLRARDELSSVQLTSCVYLIDWKSCLELGRQLTSLSWSSNFGTEVLNNALEHPQFFHVRNGSRIVLVRSRRTFFSEEEQKVIRHVLRVTKDMSPAGVVKLVNSTYPVMVSGPYQSLNLPWLAKVYKNQLV